MAHAPSENSLESLEKDFRALGIADTTPDSTSGESSSGSGEATSDGRECDGDCDGNPIYGDDEHIKRDDDNEAILGSHQQFCAAFYHVPKWTYKDSSSKRRRHVSKRCLDKQCIISTRKGENSEWFQPKVVVAVVKYETGENHDKKIRYQAKYTNCSTQKKHAEDFFRYDAENGKLAKKIEKHREGTLTIYITLQPCNLSTTIKPEGTDVTRPNHSCCKTLRDIYLDKLQGKRVKLCVIPTHLCNLGKVKNEDAGDEKDYVTHDIVRDELRKNDGTSESDKKKKKFEHFRKNAVRGMKMLMKLNDVEVRKMEKEDWDYLWSINHIKKPMSKDEYRLRKELDQCIGKVINDIESQLSQQPNQGKEA